MSALDIIRLILAVFTLIALGVTVKFALDTRRYRMRAEAAYERAKAARDRLDWPDTHRHILFNC